VLVPVADAGAAVEELEEEDGRAVLDAEVVIDDGVVLCVELADGDWTEEEDDFTDVVVGVVLVGAALVEVDATGDEEGVGTEDDVGRVAVGEETGEDDTEDDADEMLVEADMPPLAIVPTVTPVE
jgi:hypothetical protein